MTDETEVVTDETVVPAEADLVATGSEEAAPSGLEALGALKEEQEVVLVREPKLDAFGRAYATGKRKNAIARVWIKPGAGPYFGKWTRSGDVFRAAGPSHAHRATI